MLRSSIEDGHEVYNGEALAFLKAQETSSHAVISAFHLIEHLEFEHFYNIVKECYRVLLSGGVVIFETPNAENIYVASNTFFLDPTHKRIMPSDLIKFVFKVSKFDRSVALPMQSPNFNESNVVNLSEMFFGIGYDVAVIAQKRPETTEGNALDEFFDSAVEQKLLNRLDGARELLNLKFGELTGSIVRLMRI